MTDKCCKVEMRSKTHCKTKAVTPLIEVSKGTVKPILIRVVNFTYSLHEHPLHKFLFLDTILPI